LRSTALVVLILPADEVFGTHRRLHWWTFAAAVLLLSFALTMSCALGVKAPLDYSIWTAAAAAFLLGMIALRKHDAGPA
jgi:hypothetical protein